MTKTLALQAHHLDYAFGELRVLHDVSIALPRGTVTAILGPNGSGKSTLLEILAGVRHPLAGRVFSTGPIALVVQRTTTPELLPLTVFDVVSMSTWSSARPWGRGMRRAVRLQAVEDALTRVDLSAFAGRAFTALSGGQRQRVLLAQALARHAPILLLDEPSTGLDAESRDRTRAILAEEAARGVAVAVVTHDAETTNIADAVVRLGDSSRSFRN